MGNLHFAPSTAIEDKGEAVTADVNDSDEFFQNAIRSRRRKHDYSQRIEALLRQMTVEEKVGQMTQLTLAMIVNGHDQNIEVDPAKSQKAIGEYSVASIINVYDQALTPNKGRDIITQIQNAAKKTRVVSQTESTHGAGVRMSKSFRFIVGTLMIFFVMVSSRSDLAARSLFRVSRQTLSIEGVLLDQNGSPVVGAEVTLASGAFRLQTRTDVSGRFRFGSVQPSLFTLLIKAEGFARLERTLNPGSEETSQLRIILVPAPISERVTVTATRTDMRIGDTAASVAVLRSDDLRVTASVTVDDALRQVPGFSLFRRSGSRTANPTSQGVSLRGLGASGASRGIVLFDNVPLNDPFGGWVYWSCVPRESIKEIEVLRGGASDLYGSSALGGIVNVITKPSDVNALSLEASYGNQLTPDATVFFGRRLGEWSVSLAAESFRTNGFILVDQKERGSVDTAAGSRHSVIKLRVQRSFGDNRRLFGDASFFGESRTNGTPLTPNRTHIRQFTFGGDWQTSSIGLITARFYGGTQVFDQNFSAVSADRNSEALTRVQRVPVQNLGLTAQWSRSFRESHTIVAGVDVNQVRGASDEIAFASGRATALVGAGGRQATVAGYFEDLIKLNSRVFLTVGARLDHWRNYAAVSASRPLTSNLSSTITRFSDRSETALSPRISVLYKLTPHVSLTGSVSRAFRAATLNELYRSFRVGNVMTLANSNLRAERLTTGEAGVRFYAFKERLVVGSTGFWASISEPVANVTLTTTPTLITRQRQNLGRTRSRGIEIETNARLRKYWNLSAGYLFANASVVKFPANTALEGLMIPQVARHQFTFQLRYANPSVVTVGLQGRSSSAQFDDDQNLFRLAPYFALDLFVSRRIARKAEVFVAIENLFNQRYEVGKTPVTTLGPPTLLRGGIRLSLSK